MIEIIPNWHPVFVHFTVALFTLSALLFAGGLLVSGELRKQWQLVARWLLWFGMGFTILTGASGIYAYNTVIHDDPSHLAMTDHRNWALATIALFLILTAWSVTWFRQNMPPLAFVMAMIIAAGILSSTAWRGGEVVYRYGLGVMSLPKVSNHEHQSGDAHEHPSGEPSESHHPSLDLGDDNKMRDSKPVQHDDGHDHSH